jgi:hypothetical protein
LHFKGEVVLVAEDKVVKPDTTVVGIDLDEVTSPLAVDEI